MTGQRRAVVAERWQPATGHSVESVDLSGGAARNDGEVRARSGSRLIVRFVPKFSAGASMVEKSAKNKAAKAKVKKVMHEHKHGTLKTGSGKKVRSRKQAVAIAMSESGQSRRRNKK
jgi:hypothetical protein